MLHYRTMKLLIIDVREPSEYNLGHVEGALNIPPSELLGQANLLKEIPKDTAIVLYCVSGSRSNVAINILQNQGFTNLTNGINKQQVENKYMNTI